MRSSPLLVRLLGVVVLAACQGERLAPTEGSSASVQDTTVPAIVRCDTAGRMTIQRAPNNSQSSLNAGASLRRRHIAVRTPRYQLS